MKKYWKTLACCLAFAILMACCVLLYKKLSEDYGTDGNLEINGQLQEDSDENADKEQSETAEQQENMGQQQESQQENSSEAPDFTVENSEGEMISLSSLRGKPVVLNFWASWCPPCKSEMPDFQKAYETYGEDIQFVMVNLTDGSRETKESAEKFIEEQGYTFPIYYDVNMEAAYAYYVNAVPATYFINTEGEIVAAGRGMLDAESLEEGISVLNAQ